MAAATEPRRSGGPALLCLVAGVLGFACDPHSHPPATTAAGESWSLTAWGKLYEVYPEARSLQAGTATEVHTHVTILEGHAPLEEGSVEVVLASAGGEQAFRASQAESPGLFGVEVLPAGAGDFDLTFRISGPAGDEEIRGGRIRVGARDQPGRLLVAPAPRGGTGGGGGAPLSLLKEQQWQGRFGTSWVRSGQLARAVSGLARVRPPAGGDPTVTSPVDGVLQPPAGSASWPFVGRGIEKGSALFRVAPRIAVDHSLSNLEAEIRTIEADRDTARARLSRLEELLALEATSRREVEEAAARVETLDARWTAATRDLEAAHAFRDGDSAGSLVLRAPISGRIATVFASPGATVAAGQPLARLVRTDRLWIEVTLSPDDARQLETGGVAGLVLSRPETSPVRIEDDLRWISTAPEASPGTGTLTVLLETPAVPGVTLGTTWDAQILLEEQREGVVVPSTALVDDGGVAVVYLQLAGESFIRQPVEVLDRQGTRVLVEGLVPGQRLVHRGGESIRRASLLASGTAHGHVH